MVRLYNCIDAGSKYCPCNLADSMDCISCSQLRGEDYCDCDWNGVCILYEYYMQNKHSNDFRKSYTGFVESKIELEKNLFLLKISVDVELIEELNKPSSYIFIKSLKDANYFETPMSIFDITKEHIYIVYQEIGSKTKKVKYNEQLSIRGPYWNGIIGDNKLYSTENSKVLVIARGIGQSSILMLLKSLVKKGSDVVLLLDKGKLDTLYCLDFFPEKYIKVEEVDSLSVEGKEKIKFYINNYSIDLVFSAGSDMLHRKVCSILNEVESKVKLFVTNNNIFCCGEGICGSCIRKIESGERIKTCKTMIDPRKIY